MRVEFIPVGQIVNAHGIRGEVKLNPLGFDPEFLAEFDVLYIGGKRTEVKHARVHKSVVLLTLPGVEEERLRWLIRFDCLLRDRPGKLPEAAKTLPDLTGSQKSATYAFYSDPENRARYLKEYADLPDFKQIAKLAAIEVFPFDPRAFLSPDEGEDLQPVYGETALLFNYRRPDIFGNASVTAIELPRP